MLKTAICDKLAMHTLGLLHLLYSNKPLTLYQRTRNLLFLLWTRRGFSLNTDRTDYQTAIDSINQQLLFWTLQTVIYDKFSSSFYVFVYLSQNVKERFKMARWQDGKWNFKLSRAYAGNFFWAKVFFLRTHEGFAKNGFLSCHLAIFVSLIPFLKGVGCRV